MAHRSPAPQLPLFVDHHHHHHHQPIYDVDPHHLRLTSTDCINAPAVIYVYVYDRRGVEGGERACPWLPTACVEPKKLRRRERWLGAKGEMARREGRDGSTRRE